MEGCLLLTIVICDLTQGDKALLVEDEADTNTNTSETSSTTNSVKVGFWVWLRIIPSLHWNIVIDDHRYGLNINTSC